MRAVKPFFVLFLLLPSFVLGQYFEMPEGKKQQKIKFQHINNLIIIPAKVNGTELSFILDTGVSKPILFNLTDNDSVDIKNVSKITLKGLGDGEPIEALGSKDNVFGIGNITNKKQNLYVVLDKELNFSPKLGIPVHGIVGYNFFRDFIVEINYAAQNLKIYDPEHYRYRVSKKAETLPLTIENKKAYVIADAIIDNSNKIPVKLLLDTGSSDAVWLFENENKGINVPEQNFTDFLGKGLSGTVNGKRSKIKQLNLGSFSLTDAKAAFPDKESIKGISNLETRNGSLGGEVLKRFNIILDYSGNKITLKKNSYFKQPFRFNTSGMELQHDGVRVIRKLTTNSRGIVKTSGNGVGNDITVRFANEIVMSLVPQIIVSEIRADSPAKEAGLEIGDVILSVDKKAVHDYKLQEIKYMLDKVPGRKVTVLVSRNGEKMRFNLRIKKLF